MGIVRTAQPSRIALPGLKVEAYAAATAMPIGISLDRKTVYGAALGSNTQLQQSTDDGATWSNVYAFPQPVLGVLETDDGEALAYLQTTGATPGLIYKSTGWSTSHTTATWALKLTSTGGYFRPAWSGHAWTFGNDKIRTGTSAFGVVSEYGGQTTASGDQTGKATRVYATTDYGNTWTLILDLQVRYPGIYPLHVHNVAYDPYWDRIWVLYGDTAADGASNLELLYSDDRGTTWNTVPVGTGFAYNAAQCTTIAVQPDCIILGGDNAPGYLRFARKGYRVLGPNQATAHFCGGTGAQMIAQTMYQNRNQPGAPVIACSSSASADTIAPLMVSLDGGATMQQIWEDSSLRGSAKGFRAAYGPTYNGKIVGWVSPNGADWGSGTHYLLRGELVVPEPGLLDGTATLTGDGSTTVFTIPHGLGVAPSRYVVWQERVVGTYTVTRDATNLTITFAAAPASGPYPFQWRAGA